MRVRANDKNRFMELEGLRVVAAIIVVLFHAALMFYPAHFFGVGDSDSPVLNMRLEDNIHNNLFAGLISGTFAVGIFFVLSGFVLSVGFFAKKDPRILKRLAAKRYIRLMIPALVSVLITWLVMSIGLTSNLKEVVAITNSGWLSHTWSFQPVFWDALYQGTIGVFTSLASHYNPVLWTISVEFIGSFIVFAIALLFGDSRHRWLAYAVVIVLLFNSWILAMVLGMILADIYVNRQVVFHTLAKVWVYLLLIVGVILGGHPDGVVSNPVYQLLSIPGYTQDQNRALFISIGAALLVFALLSLPALRRFFAHNSISRFGKYTYSLYLIHFAVWFTVGAAFFVGTISLGYHVAALIAVAAGLLTLVPVTYLYERYIDRPSIKLSSYIADVLFGTKDLELRRKYRRAQTAFVSAVLDTGLGLRITRTGEVANDDTTN